VRTALAFIGIALVATTGAVPAANPGELAVMTFNIQHGIDGSHKYNLQRAIDTIAKAQPDVVALQEITRNHPYYNCEDQPARIAEGLKAATGRAWSVAYQQEWFTPNVECQQAGKGDGKETEGLAFLSPEPLGDSSWIKLPSSRIAFTVKPPSAGGMAMTVTHLASGKNDGPARAREVEAIAKWTGKLGRAQVLLGDFNLKPDEPELQPVLGMFTDAWKAGADAGVASGSGATHRENRIDFIFYKGDGVAVSKIETVETASWFGTSASDHKPVLAHLRVP
jgi:endonuclease/exonuclease/phosphatase family metal-dependent hydrolase